MSAKRPMDRLAADVPAGEVIEAFQTLRWRHGSRSATSVMVGLPLLSGTLYLLIQIREIGVALDDVFVGLLLGATYMLVQGMRLTHAYIRRRAPVFFRQMKDRAEAEGAVRVADRFVRETFSDKWMALGGGLYGVAIASGAVFLLGPWPSRPWLRGLLWLFLFSVNYVAGIGFVGLTLLFRSMWRARNHLVVTIWRRSNESTRFVDDLRIRSASLAAAYVGLALTSIGFSVLPMGSLVTTYALFAATIILAALGVPGLVVRSRLEEARGEAMTKVDVGLQQEFKSLFAASSAPESEQHLKKIDGLLTLREKIESLAPPPVNWRSLRAAMGVAAMTTLPIIVKQLLAFLA